MGTYIPRYLVGRNVIACGCDSVMIAADGTLVAQGNYTNFHNYGTLDTFELETNYGLEEISGTDAAVENYVETKSTWTCTLGEIRSASGASKIEDARSLNSAYMLVDAYTQDPVTGSYVYVQVVGIIDNVQRGIKMGKNVVTCTLRPCGIAPYYEVGDSSGVYSGTPGSTGNIRTAAVVTSKHA